MPRLLVIASTLALLAAPARADDEVEESPHVDAAAFEQMVTLAIPAFYYWNTGAQQKVDWTYPSWTDKLTLGAFRFDTNAFFVNTVRHPMVGVIDYHIMRTNGFGVVRSTVFTYLASLIWELGIEYREYPSINDVIMNGAGGLAIGEPLYQLGQLWRGESPSLLDRARTAITSPFDAAHDLWRRHRWRKRPAAADFLVYAGAAHHELAGNEQRDELVAGIDFDVIRHAGFVEPGAHEGDIEPGAWSRFAVDVALPTEGQRMSMRVSSRTTLFGHYAQDAGGDGALVAVASAFTYHRDVLANESDHVAIAQLAGPMFQLIRRGTTTLRFELAAYADFGLIDAHVFHPTPPFPEPPPMISTLQAEGYYDGAGMSVESRLRIDRGPWRADLEVSGHRLWSLDFADREAVPASRSSSPVPLAPHGVSDSRIYGRAAFGVHGEQWGVAAIVDTASRDGTWSNFERTTSDWRAGVELTSDL